MLGPCPAGAFDAANAARPVTRPIARIHLLGSMRATTYLGDGIVPDGRKARALLGYLCLAAGAPVARAQLAALLWDDAPPARALCDLRDSLGELVSAFGPFANELIDARGDAVTLNVDECWIDALAAAAAKTSPHNSPRSELAAICGGLLLEGLEGTSAAFDRWLLGERTRLARQMRSLLEEVDRPGPAPAATAPYLQPVLAAPASGRSRPRVGVLPFAANDPAIRGLENKEKLAFSLSQEIAAGLARFRWFDVLAPVSLQRLPSADFIGDQHQHGDLDYLVDGTISLKGRHLHIGVRLLDVAERIRPAWSDSFKLERSELHRLDELVTVRIVARIDPVILHIEGRPKRRNRYGATGLVLLAIPLFFSMERKKYEEAGQLIDRALMLEPDNAMVEAWAAHWHLFHVGQGWATDPEAAHLRAREHASRAVALDPENAEALGIYAHCCSVINKDFDAALRYFDRALRVNPSLAFNWALSAATCCYIGEPDAALQRLERYRDLAPVDPYFSWFETLYTIAYTFKGDYERAVLVGRRTVKANPAFVAGYKPLIASLGHLRRRDEAQPYVRKLLSLEPAFTVERFGKVYHFKHDADRETYLAGLRLAGVPER